MGYIKGLSCKYSKGHHGYLYDVDYWKYKGWGCETFEDVCFDEETPCPIPDYADEWLYATQMKTIKSIKVDDCLLSVAMKEKDALLGNLSSSRDTDSCFYKKLKLINDIENLHHKTESGLRITADGATGRTYSIMTRLRSDVRHGNYLTIDGEGFKEVDLSNAQPTLLGLRVKRKLKEQGKVLHSLWLGHALMGDFYEWLIDITCLLEDRSVDDIISDYNDLVSKNKKSKKKKVREQALEEQSILYKVNGMTSTDPYTKLRPLIKHWIIKSLFGKQIVGTDNKEPKSIEKVFLKNLWKYLKENEPDIYAEILWHKKHPEPKKKKPSENASELARKSRREEWAMQT